MYYPLLRNVIKLKSFLFCDLCIVFLRTNVTECLISIFPRFSIFVCIQYIKCFRWGTERFPLGLFVCLLFFSCFGKIISRELITNHCCLKLQPLISMTKLEAETEFSQERLCGNNAGITCWKTSSLSSLSIITWLRNPELYKRKAFTEILVKRKECRRKNSAKTQRSWNDWIKLKVK